MRHFVVRIAITSSFVCAIVIFVLLWNLRIVLPLIAYFVPRWEALLHDLGAYGLYRSRSYSSFDLTPPYPSAPQWVEQCDDGGYIVLTPKGSSVSYSGPTILNTRGDLVWMSHQYPNAMNLQFQIFNGSNYLTFWSGSKTGGQGEGSYYLLDSSYNIAHIITAVGTGVHGDFHEFKITHSDTALITIYNKTTTNLSSIGRPLSGWISDSVFQEIDIHTNALIFEWRASEHFDANESYMTHPLAGYVSSVTFDSFHINSVDKDAQGNYLISSRHLHAVVCISPAGETLWVLGGKRNQFTWLTDSDGKAPTPFRWQHDARWLEEPDEEGLGVLTLFDNQEGGILHVDGPYSRGLKLRVDVSKMTVEVMCEYVSLQKTRAPSQGGMQVLDNGNVFIGWGHSAAYSEFDANGTLLCESHFGASWYGGVVSYRASKIMEGDWSGRPEGPPDAKLEGGTVCASWNGATDVAAWTLEGRSQAESQWMDIDVIEKQSFEESFVLSNSGEGRYHRYRVAALDKMGQIIGYSEVMEDDPNATSLNVVISGLMWVGVFLCAWMLWKQRRRSKNWIVEAGGFSSFVKRPIVTKQCRVVGMVDELPN
jgi:hypothetical protein